MARKRKVPTGFARLGSKARPMLVDERFVDVAPERWWSRGEPLAGARGRGGVAVLDIPADPPIVARDFRRGGVLGGLLGRCFLSKKRAFAELRALAALREAGVPVVEPVAALTMRRGLVTWRHRLATRLVEGATPLPAFVAAHPERRRAVIRRAGEVVRDAFAAGLRHPDLHPDNFVVALRDGELDVRLLDLDRAHVLRALVVRERDDMLLRMARYLVRHRDDLPTRGSRTDQIRFLQALGWDRRRRRDGLRRLVPRFVRMLARHRLPAPA